MRHQPASARAPPGADIRASRVLPLCFSGDWTARYGVVSKASYIQVWMTHRATASACSVTGKTTYRRR